MMNAFRFLPLTLLMVLMSTTTHLAAQQIVAHRGASFDAPENTLAAFELAWKQGADAIEGDFYLTADQQIVCLHDKTTKRVAPDQPIREVSKATLEQLQSLDVGSWKSSEFSDQRIPTLEQVLATLPAGKQIFVEIKCGIEILPILKAQLESTSLSNDQIVLICFSEEVVSTARQMMPQFNANWLTGYKQSKSTGRWSPTTKSVLASLKKTSATGLGTNANMEVIDADFVRRIRSTQCELHAWTVNDISVARTLAKMGFASITTDRPALIRNALQPPSVQ